MAFVNEEIITEEDKAYFNSFGIKDPFTGKLHKSKEWTIDRERNMFLVDIAGQGTEYSEIPMYYAFVYKNRVLEIPTYSKTIGNRTTGMDMYWEINISRPPKEFMDELSEIFEYLREAFTVYGSYYDNRGIKSVKFQKVSKNKI